MSSINNPPLPLFADDLVFSGNNGVRRNTSDSSDTGYVAVSGGGAEGSDRGAHLTVYGNEHATLPGRFIARMGTGGRFAVYDQNGSTVFEILSSTGAASFGSVFALKAGSVTLDSDANNWTPTGLHTNTAFIIGGASANRNITGLDSTGVADGTIKIFHNRTAFSYTFKDEDGSSSAANRFRAGNTTDVILRLDGALMMIYLSTRWCILVV